MKISMFLVLSLLSVACLLAKGLDEQVGFQRGRLSYSVEVKLEKTGCRQSAICLLAKGTSFEVIKGGEQVRVLLDDGSLTSLPREAVQKSGKCWSIPRSKLTALAKKLKALPVRTIAEGITYVSSLELGSRLNFVTIGLHNSSHYEPAVVVSPRFRKTVTQSRRRWLNLSHVASENEAVLALSGTFYACCRKHGGRPLGRVVSDGLVLEPPKKFKEARRRASYIWTHSGHHRLVSAEVAKGMKQETVAEMGGLGTLVERGDTDAWRGYLDKHFKPSFYSGFTRRPQVLFGTNKRGNKLWILVQEGRPRSPRPWSLPELGYLLSRCGAWDVAFSDGGSTADLLINGKSVVQRGRGCRRELHSTAWIIRPRKEVRNYGYCED